MPSYYNRIKGTLEVAKLAKSSDIHLIQSSIQDAISSVITDMFGPSFVLGEAENDLKLVPTAVHVDQISVNYDEEDQWISFYERYFRQAIFIEKSSIESITLHMINDSNITTTVYAEIRDINYNLLKETNAKLYPTTQDEFQEVEFNFNLHHLGVGRYYFILKPIDISASDLALNGDESKYDTITPEMFCVKYDREGEYMQGLEASYDGVNYLDSYLLEDQLEYDDTDSFIVNDTNFDLYFEHTFSSGNTYLINPGAAIVHGQKVYPIDTHVTIAGPSPLGNRTDLVILTQEGFLKVIQGNVYSGAVVRPQSDSGLKIAYITSYKSENAEWTCPNCHTVNDGNTGYCYNCGSTVNTRIPLIEQADDNGMTRQRDVLERLRRLEKMLAYEQEYNRPTRVKYTCTNDPIIYQNPDDLNNEFDEADGTYGMTTVMINGERVNIPTGSMTSLPYTWSIINRDYTIKHPNTSIYDGGNLYAWDLYIPYKKPTKVKNFYLYTIFASDAKAKPIKGLTANIEIKKGNKSVKKFNVTTNSNGYGRYNIYSLISYLRSGKYTMIASYNGKSVKTTLELVEGMDKDIYVDIENEETSSDISTKKSNTYTTKATIGKQTIKISWNKDTDTDDPIRQQLTKATIYDTYEVKNSKGKKVTKEKKYVIKRHGVKISIYQGEQEGATETVTNVKDPNTITGADSFYFENAVPDYEKGVFKIAAVNNRDDEYTTNKLVSESNGSSKQEITYKLFNNIKQLNSQYPVLNFQFEGGYIHSLTPYVKKFKNVESFQIILFENNLVFGQDKNQRVSYQKRLDGNDEFPNLYVSDMIEIAGISRSDKSGNRILNNYHTFIVDQEIPKGNYSLFLYAKLADGYEEGAVFIDEYEAMSEGDEFGTSTKCLGSCNPSIIYLETNNITSRSWDLLIEKHSNQYKATGIVISKPISVGKDKNIRSVTIDYNKNIPNGCDLQIQVSNDGGRNWVTARNNLVTFSGLGNVFEWKVVMRSNGGDTAVISFDKEKEYAIRVVLNITDKDNYVEYEDYGRCMETPVMDFVAMTYKVFGDSTITQKDFSEWEWARLFMTDEVKTSEIQILISNGNTDNGPIYTSQDKDTWNRQLFFHQAICGLTINDFSHTSIDYSNYDADLEYDEYNYRFKYDTEYGEVLGSGEVVGTYKNALEFQKHPNIDTPQFEADASHINDKYSYEGNYGNEKTQYSGMHVTKEPCYGYKYKGPADTQKEMDYYNSNNDDSYDRKAVIVGMLFEDGLTINDKYTDLTLDIIPTMDTKDNRPCDSDKPTLDSDGNYIYEGEGDNKHMVMEKGDCYFPPKVFELIVSLNPYGIMDDDATYGKTYDINQNLYCDRINRVSIPLYDDFVGAEIYSIGIRVKDIDNKTINEAPTSYTTIKAGDGIYLGNLTLGGHDRKLYWPATNKCHWKKGGIVADDGMTLQHSYACVMSSLAGKPHQYIFPLTDFPVKSGDNGLVEDPHYKGTDFKTKPIDEGKFRLTHEVWDSGIGTPIYYEKTIHNTKENNTWKQSSNEPAIRVQGDYLTDGANKTYLQFPRMIFNFIYEPAVKEPSFYIDVDFDLTPYTWVRIEHFLEAERLKQEPTSRPSCPQQDYCIPNVDLNEMGLTNYTHMPAGYWTETMGQYHAGDIVFEFYDTADHTNSSVQPIETFTLPAWGRIQTRAQRENKEVNAWFKIRNGGRVKRIVVKRKNPTGAKMWYPLKLHLYDIGMHREKTVPALGSQMQMRIYPSGEANSDNTNIRKFGVVYRIA